MKGRPLEELAAYARELGVGKRTIRIMGGVEKLKKLTPEARNVLLFPTKVGHKFRAKGFKWPDKDS